jgi:sterol desaturase/sphingolipid hydroxylase (fatty acid hydroxylase superfamily)
MSLIEILNLAPPVLFVMFHIAEAIAPARRLPRSLDWRIRGLVWFLISGALFTNAPRLWSGWATENSLLNLQPAGLWGALFAVLVANVIGYGWHRARHSVPFLWRFHQLHHSAERLDVSGAFLFHPLETLAMAFLFSVSSTLILGVSPEAAALAGTIGFFCACFQHANVRTPRWLGYFIQRPESHSVHHARGLHAFNYTDLPLFDLLFGSFKNPERPEAELGFYDGASRRVGRMLLALDNARPPAAPEGSKVLAD